MRISTRLMLDTNVWLGWLVFADAGVGPGADAVLSTPEQFVKFLAGERAQWAKAAKSANLSPL